MIAVCGEKGVLTGVNDHAKKHGQPVGHETVPNDHAKKARVIYNPALMAVSPCP